MPVTVEKRTIVTFFVSSPTYTEYRHTFDGKWVPDEKRTDDEIENGSGDLIFADDILDTILPDCEVCTGGPDMSIEIDADDCPFTLESIKDILETISAKFDNGDAFTSVSAPYTRNMGTEDYHDPKRVIPSFLLPGVPQMKHCTSRTNKKHR